jgi:hypothetical protein
MMPIVKLDIVKSLVRAYILGVSRLIDGSQTGLFVNCWLDYLGVSLSFPNQLIDSIEYIPEY